MLKFWFHKYNLHPLTQLGALAAAEPRPGALLKIQWPNGKTGYADLFPWPELGDADLDTQLISIKKGHLSFQVEQSIWLAKRDAEARAEGKNAFQKLDRVKNHFLINDPARLEDATLMEIKSAGFTSVKIKMGRNLEAETKFVEKVLKQHQQLFVRLDFNASISADRFEKFINGIAANLRPRIEFVEDPCPYDEKAWEALNKIVPLAMDQEYDKCDIHKMLTVPFRTLIIKPARMDVDKAVEHAKRLNLKLVVTSALDHPVGVAHAVWVAGGLKKQFPNDLLDCGCLSLRSYKSNEFTSAVSVQGPYVVGVNGQGVGFDSLFEKIAWTPIQDLK